MATSHFAATPQSDVVRICAHGFQRHGDAFGVKNHPKPWTCPLSEHDAFPAALWKISCDKRSVVMIGNENSRVLFFDLFVYNSRYILGT